MWHTGGGETVLTSLRGRPQILTIGGRITKSIESTVLRLGEGAPGHPVSYTLYDPGLGFLYTVVSQNSKSDLRIVGFDGEEERLKQRATYRPQTSLQLPQGNYIFCEFHTLKIPGIQLTPPSEASERIHMLACDTEIVDIMNKHRWWVGAMSEKAPEGYVGISPKSILDMQNQEEEISLESVRKTLLHEFVHMVYSEHDADSFALNKQLNEKADSLDWTNSTSHTLSGQKNTHNYEEVYIDPSSENIGQKLGGVMNSSASARASSTAAACCRLLNVSAKELLDYNKSVASQGNFGSEPDPDDAAVHDEPDPDDSLNGENMFEFDSDAAAAITVSATKKKLELTANEPDPDDTESSGDTSNKLDTQSQKEPDADESTQERFQQSAETSPATDNSMQVDHVHGLGSQELQRIEEPAAVFCSCLQRAIDILRSEATPSQTTTALQTLFRAISISTSKILVLLYINFKLFYFSVGIFRPSLLVDQCDRTPSRGQV